MRWARREMTWPELRQAVTEFKVTPETISEYLCMDRERQTQIKDVGGFVGGELEGGVRKKANLRSRSIITLDFDGFTAGQFAELRGMFPGVCWAVYSTHKHTTREWRVRVVMPLARDVTPDEYVAVSRRVAETIGMQGIDRTTFEPCRLMFWPSRSVDAPWIDEGHDADAFLDPDRILDTYDDWRDPAQWPRTAEEADIFATCAMPTGDPRVMEIWRQYTAAAKGGGDGSTLEDPASKPGVVGAFCRSYGIDEAIAAFLPDTYTRYRAGRYTYAAGRTVGGAVVYDDKWLFSHHATDPAGGRVLNAWDLVRVHRFGYLDDGSRATKTAQLPSQRAMTELAMKDRGTARLVAEETAERGRMAFEGIRVPDVTDENDGDEAGTPEDRWADTEASMRNRKGEFVCTRANLTRVLMEHPVFAGKLRYNTFSGRMEVRVGAMPWPRPKEITADKNGKTALPVGVEEFDDTDAACLRSWMETTYNVNAAGKLKAARRVSGLADVGRHAASGRPAAAHARGRGHGAEPLSVAADLRGGRGAREVSGHQVGHLRDALRRAGARQVVAGVADGRALEHGLVSKHRHQGRLLGAAGQMARGAGGDGQPQTRGPRRGESVHLGAERHLPPRLRARGGDGGASVRVRGHDQQRAVSARR